MDTGRDRSLLALPDGRELAWLEVGDPDGVVVLSHHGGLVSASDVVPLAEAARGAGVRLVSFDRPGIGGSSPQPGRTMLDGARDAELLLDHLGVAEIQLLGWSMGGQYALATAHHLGARVRRTALVAGCPPLDDPATLAELNAMDRSFTALAQDHVRMLEVKAAALGGLARFLPRVWARASAKGEPAVDAAAIEAAGGELAASAADAVAHGTDGVVEEYRAWVRPWGFTLADITTQVDVWQGSADHLVPAAWGARLAAALPAGTLHAIDGEGHFLLLTHGAEVLGALVPRSG